MVNIHDVARVAGVSKSTVSRYLNNGYVSKNSREKIQNAIEELGYKPNALGKMFKDNSTKTIALCVPMVFHPFFAQVIECIEKEAEKNGYKLLITSSQNDRAKEEEFITLLHQNYVDGIIFITHNKYDSFDSSLPVVTIDRHFGYTVPCITSDNYDATYGALTYLYETGARNIAFIGGCPQVKSEVTKRYDAYKDFIKKYNLKEISCYGDFRHGQEYEISRKFISENNNLDAVFCTSDTFGMAIYSALGYDDINGGPVKIIAFDGVLTPWIQKPKLTVIAQDVETIAKKVVDVLIKRINHEDVEKLYVVKTKFIKGETA